MHIQESVSDLKKAYRQPTVSETVAVGVVVRPQMKMDYARASACLANSWICRQFFGR